MGKPHTCPMLPPPYPLLVCGLHLALSLTLTISYAHHKKKKDRGVGKSRRKGARFNGDYIKATFIHLLQPRVSAEGLRRGNNAELLLLTAQSALQGNLPLSHGICVWLMKHISYTKAQLTPVDRLMPGQVLFITGENILVVQSSESMGLVAVSCWKLSFQQNNSYSLLVVIIILLHFTSELLVYNTVVQFTTYYSIATVKLLHSQKKRYFAFPFCFMFLNFKYLLTGNVDIAYI